MMTKSWAKRTILSSRVLRLAAKFRRNSAVILMYHSVLPDPSMQADSLGGISHDEVTFRDQMELLAREFRPTSLDEVLTALKEKRELPRRSVVVTFDDGYADNFEVAMPILNQVGVPATFYVTVDCVENKKLPWPSRLRFAFRRTKAKAWLDSRGKVWSLKNAFDREQAYLSACDVCCCLTGATQNRFVERFEQELGANVAVNSDGQMMTYEQVKGLIRHGHIIGSHTMTHPNMAHVGRGEACQELTESKRRLESELGMRIKHFSYPCPALSPHWSEQTIEQSCATGYETAVTTDRGVTRSGDNPLCLKRLGPTRTVEGLRWNLDTAFAGWGS